MPSNIRRSVRRAAASSGAQRDLITRRPTIASEPSPKPQGPSPLSSNARIREFQEEVGAIVERYTRDPDASTASKIDRKPGQLRPPADDAEFVELARSIARLLIARGVRSEDEAADLMRETLQDGYADEPEPSAPRREVEAGPSKAKYAKDPGTRSARPVSHARQVDAFARWQSDFASGAMAKGLTPDQAASEARRSGGR